MNREKLIRCGIDYNDGVHRFMDKTQVYEKYLLKFFGSSDLPALRRALESGQYDDAFRMAHNLKGSAGTLSVAAFYGKISELTDALRAGVRDDTLLSLCGEAEALYETARNAVKESSNGYEN